jgi:predicted nucleic acid-binding protein
MTIYVVDATVAVGWSITLPYTHACNRLLQEASALIAPDLIIAEVTNAFFQQAKTGLADTARLTDALNLLPRWFAEIVPCSTLRVRAFQLANELQHPAYDCFYLALALDRNVKFLSADVQFLRKVQATSCREYVQHIENWPS